MNNLKILVKFPSRERPMEFLKTLEGYISMQTTNDVNYMITIDQDDMSMVNITSQIYTKNNVSINLGKSKNKIDAVNRGIDKYTKQWDILVLASDDMICQVKGWDTILKEEIIEHFPDTDGVLWHNDGYLGQRLNTMCILGRKYYQRFNYIYNPDYTSLWADNEFMEVAQRLDKQKYFEQCLFKHEHFSNNGNIKADLLMKKNESFYHIDQAVYNKRKQNNFYVQPK